MGKDEFAKVFPIKSNDSSLFILVESYILTPAFALTSTATLNSYNNLSKQFLKAYLVAQN